MFADVPEKSSGQTHLPRDLGVGMSLRLCQVFLPSDQVFLATKVRSFSLLQWSYKDILPLRSSLSATRKWVLRPLHRWRLNGELSTRPAATLRSIGTLKKLLHLPWDLQASRDTLITFGNYLHPNVNKNPFRTHSWPFGGISNVRGTLKVTGVTQTCVLPSKVPIMIEEPYIQ